jgi:hypothetical protein
LVHYFKTLGNYFVGDYIVGNYQNCWERWRLYYRHWWPLRENSGGANTIYHLETLEVK